MIITTAEQLRSLTGSYYANNDFSKIENTVKAVEQELCTTLGMQTLDNLQNDTLLAAQQAIAFMATMRFYRLNDISHENAGRKVKIDKENEARPFEWQLARDDRAHLEEYYRALDRLISLLQDNTEFQESKLYKRSQSLIVEDADALSYLTGVDPSPWLYLRMIPYLDESQRFAAKAYGSGFRTAIADAADDLKDAAQRSVALGALALMGRRTSLQTMPYGLMKLTVSEGGGNVKGGATLDELDAYLKKLSKEQRYWIEEMKRLLDEAAGLEAASHLQMPENDKHNKFMRV